MKQSISSIDYGSIIMADKIAGFISNYVYTTVVVWVTNGAERLSLLYEISGPFRPYKYAAMRCSYP